jgi:hypothetical protein
LCTCQKPAIWASFSVLFHCDWTNIDWSSNWRPRGERARKTASLTYRTCRDKIRTRKLNWSYNDGNCKFEPESRFQPGQKTAGLRAVCVTTPPRQSRLDFWTVREPNRTVYLVQIRTAGGLPGPVANTTYEHTLQQQNSVFHLNQLSYSLLTCNTMGLDTYNDVCVRRKKIE